MTALEQLDKAEAAAEGFRYDHEAFDAVRTALEAAQQEAGAWEAIEAWCRVKVDGYGRAMNLEQWFDANHGVHFYRFSGTDSVLFAPVRSRLEALARAAAWCRAELVE